MPSPRSSFASALLFTSVVALAACAQGSQLDAFRSSDDGDGGSDGSGGGRGGAGPSDGGGRPSGGGGAGSPVGGTTSAGSTSSTSATTSATTGATTSATTSAGATTSASTGGGPDPICDPLNPAIECGANQHCTPELQGVDPTCSPAGAGQHYDPCLGETDCTAITACIDVGDPLAFPCCLQYCRNSGDCGGFDTCYFFDPPRFAGGVQYGVCFDGDFGYGCF